MGAPNDDAPSCDSLEDELEYLQQQLTLIEALKARNEAQLDSFVDEREQWESLEPGEQALLHSEEPLAERIDEITTMLVQEWMGEKIQDG